MYVDDPEKPGRRRVHLMRHGAVSYLLEDGRRVADTDLVLLTAEGEAQARAMGALLADVPLDRAFCTGLMRTRQTAEHVLAGRALTLEAVEPLREIRAGHVDELPEAALEDEYVYAALRAHEPGRRFGRGEAYADFYARVTAAFERLLLEGDWQSALLVAHGHTNRALLAWTTGAGLAGFGHVEQDLGCLNVLDFDVVDGRIARRFVRLINFTPENPAKRGVRFTSLERYAWNRARLRDAALKAKAGPAGS